MCSKGSGEFLDVNQEFVFHTNIPVLIALELTPRPRNT